MNLVIKNVLVNIINQGFQAYIVGGFVRDYLLGKESFDVDIATDARPEDLQNLFCGQVNSYGIHFKEKDFNFTITTFRKESDYIGHKPMKIEFVSNLETDLKRRDFTMNTICMDSNENIIDIYEGREALVNNKIILIGDMERLKEDSLRMLRAIRFATVLDFSLDSKIEKGLQKYGTLLKNLSGYRIREEMDLILKSKNFRKGLHLLEKYNLLKLLHLNYKEIKYTEDLMGMWAQIEFPDYYPFTKKERERIVKLRGEL